MFNGNKFLEDFVRMRQQITTKEEKPKGNSIKRMPEPETDTITLRYIISEKPSRKEVVSYFRTRVDELIAEAEED
jgi:hypothetical protein